MQILRDYQSKALDALRAELRAGRKHPLLVAPTGSGKTTIAAAMISSAVSRGRRVLFLAHRKELIDQCSARLDGVGVKHGVIMAGHPRWHPLLPVQVASVQTLARRVKPEADLLVVDEAHHARAGTYAGILAHYPAAPVVGLTATPWRQDGRGLGELFDGLVVAASPRELVDQGHLVPVTGWAYGSPDLAAVKRTAGEYVAGGLELVMGDRVIVGGIVERWKEHAQGARTIGFACSVLHSQAMRDAFVAAGVAAEHLDGTTPKTDREAILARLASGETRVLWNVGVLTEGWDCPSVEVCILARPTLSAGLYLQMAGRILRPWPGKVAARIHDHAGCVLAHGTPLEDRDYSLGRDSDAKRGARKEAALRHCRKCFAIFEGSTNICPQCGYAGNAVVKAPREVDATDATRIEDVKPRPPVAVAKAYYQRLRAECEEKGYKSGWISHRFKARFGFYPGAEMAT